jgi:type IV pilus assembly protein PilA
MIMMVLWRAIALVLAALVSMLGLVPAQAADNAADLSVKSDMRTIATEMETFLTDNSYYPRARDVAYNGIRQISIGSVELVLGKGNRLGTIRLTADRQLYCIRVVRAAGAKQASKAWSYLSDRGGIQAGVCPQRFSKTVVD